MGIQLSTDSPSGVQAVHQYIVSAQSQLPMNVSKEADATFMRELERSDPQRHARLLRNMRLSVKAASIHTGRPQIHLTAADKQRAYRQRQTSVTKAI